MTAYLRLENQREIVYHQGDLAEIAFLQQENLDRRETTVHHPSEGQEGAHHHVGQGVTDTETIAGKEDQEMTLERKDLKIITEREERETIRQILQLNQNDQDQRRAEINLLIWKNRKDQKGCQRSIPPTHPLMMILSYLLQKNGDQTTFNKLRQSIHLSRQMHVIPYYNKIRLG